jgi:hypothetical protein
MSASFVSKSEVASNMSSSAEGSSESILGIVDLSIDPTWPAAEYRSIETVLAGYYGPGVAGTGLSPPDEPVELRARLRAAAPRLAAISDIIRGRFDRGAGGVLIPQLGLLGLEVDQRRKAVFALSVLLGDVTETEPVDHRVIWDLQVQPEEQRQFSKFSQADGEAQYHTDSTIVPIPERFFLLYAVQQANCGGGLSMFYDGRLLKQRLARTSRGRAALQVLAETPLPLRIPRAFREKYGYTQAYAYRPILAETPLWRWRKDKIEHGLIKHPECATPEVRAALDAVADELAATTDKNRQILPTDGIVIIDNHVAFHGRTGFTDPSRHLLRIRFNQPTS